MVHVAAGLWDSPMSPMEIFTEKRLRQWALCSPTTTFGFASELQQTYVQSLQVETPTFWDLQGFLLPQDLI